MLITGDGVGKRRKELEEIQKGVEIRQLFFLYYDSLSFRALIPPLGACIIIVLLEKAHFGQHSPQ